MQPFSRAPAKHFISPHVKFYSFVKTKINLIPGQPSTTFFNLLNRPENCKINCLCGASAHAAFAHGDLLSLV